MGELDFFKKLIKNPFDNMTHEEIVAHDAEIKRQEEEQEKRERIERYKKSGVPERYYTESLDTYQVTNAMQKSAAQANGE